MSIDILLLYAYYSNPFFMFVLSSQIDIVALQLHAIRHFIIVLFVSTVYVIRAHGIALERTGPP